MVDGCATIVQMNGGKEMTFTEICGWAATILFCISYFPQLLRTWSLRSVDDISPGMWYLLVVAYTSLFIYGYGLHEVAVMANATLGLSCVIMMLTMYFLYRDPRKEEARKTVRRFINEAKKKFKEKNGD